MTDVFLTVLALQRPDLSIILNQIKLYFLIVGLDQNQQIKSHPVPGFQSKLVWINMIR